MKNIPATALLAALAAALPAAADDFAGAYVGGDLGINRTGTSGAFASPTATSPSYGLEGGYGWNIGSNMLLGLDGHVGANKQTTHSVFGQYGSNAYGLGLKIGVPIDSLMPYARLGYDRTQGTGALSGFSASSPNSSLGLMYKVTPSWSLEGEWSSSLPASGGLKLKSNSLNFGLNYHFDSPSGSAAPKSKK
jgi:hypothetical protein